MGAPHDEQLREWSSEWDSYTARPAGCPNWPLFQYTDHDIRDRAYQYLRTDRLDSLPGLAVTATVLAEQRRRGVRCWVLLGREVTVLREADATWRELRMWTGLEERLLKRVVATFHRELVPGADALDRELADLLDRVPPNPLRRICELTAVNRFHTEIARAVGDLLERVCADLDEAGVGRVVIGQHAGLSPATLATRLRHRQLLRYLGAEMTFL